MFSTLSSLDLALCKRNGQQDIDIYQSPTMVWRPQRPLHIRHGHRLVDIVVYRLANVGHVAYPCIYYLFYVVAQSLVLPLSLYRKPTSPATVTQKVKHWENELDESSQGEKCPQGGNNDFWIRICLPLGAGYSTRTQRTIATPTLYNKNLRTERYFVILFCYILKAIRFCYDLLEELLSSVSNPFVPQVKSSILQKAYIIKLWM